MALIATLMLNLTADRSVLKGCMILT